ncbi:diphthamide biosynthesis protein-like protein [Xylariaceae sp. FL0255]|nr:diphthamide biosynthesis protein-like protein [Xylariaceae sp. FL0255]
MASDLSAPPILSTPAEHTFLEDTTPITVDRPVRSEDELFDVYEIARTVAEIERQEWQRVALQFPDPMLPDAPWVVNAISRELEKKGIAQIPRLYILADTSYSACCVDEIAAEHADADAVVHYGRACLSPTSRLPVLHIFTRQKLDYDAVVAAFAREYASKDTKVIVMADVMFQDHVAPVCELLQKEGYINVVATEIIRDPAAPIPNRKIDFSDSHSDEQQQDTSRFSEHQLFHISSPPTALLLTLSSRLASLCIYPIPSSAYETSDSPPDISATSSILRRRYALVIKLATAPIIGILVNTLSVKNYMSTIGTLRDQIAAAGKKSYTIVVGKLNAAKLANFAEVDGWVVVGCWESGLVDQDMSWKPVVTPFELGLALQSEDNRIWTGEWWGSIEGTKTPDGAELAKEKAEENKEAGFKDIEGGVSDEESEPPVFDLRTGKLVSNTRPMRVAVRSSATAAPDARSAAGSSKNPADGAALIKRGPGEIALVNGVASPGAEFLRSNRTWQGLGSDFSPAEDESSTVVEEGRSGIARGYTVGEEEQGRT